MDGAQALVSRKLSLPQSCHLPVMCHWTSSNFCGPVPCDNHSNSCPATDRMQLTGRTQVGQRTQMARSWVGRIPCLVTSNNLVPSLVLLNRLTSVWVEYKFHYHMKERKTWHSGNRVYYHLTSETYTTVVLVSIWNMEGYEYITGSTGWQNSQ